MTEPNTGDTPPKPPTSRRPATTDGPGVNVLDVVDYVHHDPLLGGQTQELGVVVGVEGDAVHIVPLARHRVQVSADDVTRLSADDLSADDD